MGSPHWDGWPRGLGHCPKQQRWGPRSVSRWGTGHIPSRRTCWRISGRSWRRGQADQLKANPSSWTALNIQDPDHQFLRDLEQGVPLGIWPLKKELKGEEPELQELPHPTGRGNYPLADHFSELIRGTFLERSPWPWAW